jgi:Na+-translocating ferredoxin:NAD+ oxidoreductase subunit G
MNDTVKFGSRITFFAAVSALILAVVFTITQPIISGRAEKEFQSSLHELLPSAASFQEVTVTGDIHYYQGLDAKKNIKGYVLPVTGKGYSSDISMLVAINAKKEITGLKILSQMETPGLGTRIMEIKEGEQEPWFQVQFVGKKPAEIALKKEGGKIDAITGATISSRAVTTALAKAIKALELKKVVSRRS